jgi:hypothetical protein
MTPDEAEDQATEAALERLREARGDPEMQGAIAVNHFLGRVLGGPRGRPDPMPATDPPEPQVRVPTDEECLSCIRRVATVIIGPRITLTGRLERAVWSAVQEIAAEETAKALNLNPDNAWRDTILDAISDLQTWAAGHDGGLPW